MAKPVRVGVSPYQPLELQGEQGAKEERDPDERADDEAEPEDASLRLRGSDLMRRRLGRGGGGRFQNEGRRSQSSTQSSRLLVGRLGPPAGLAHPQQWARCRAGTRAAQSPEGTCANLPQPFSWFKFDWY